RAFAGEHRPRLPARGRLPENLALAEQRRARVQIVAGDVVLREPVAFRVAEGHPDREGVRDERPRDGAAQIAAVEVAVRTDQVAAPGLEGRPAARDVDDAAKGVASEKRALRTADELNLIHVHQLDARGV